MIAIEQGGDMAIGPMVRRLLPGKAELAAARLYRRIFVDLEKVSMILAGSLQRDARLLDIGGGDGDLLNHLLSARSDIRVDMVDIAPSVGRFLDAPYRNRISIFSGTSIEDHCRSNGKRYAAALVSDVMHHVPVVQREGFLRALHGLLQDHGQLFVKDVEPGHWISTLGLYCDRYLSGDRGVTLISSAALLDLMAGALPPHSATEIGLYALDRPNYLVKADF